MYFPVSLRVGNERVLVVGGGAVALRKARSLLRSGARVTCVAPRFRAGFDRLYGFHAIRLSAVTNVYRATRDLFRGQRFARHVSPLTTTVYPHPSRCG